MTTTAAVIHPSQLDILLDLGNARSSEQGFRIIQLTASDQHLFLRSAALRDFLFRRASSTSDILRQHPALRPASDNQLSYGRQGYNIRLNWTTV